MAAMAGSVEKIIEVQDEEERRDIEKRVVTDAGVVEIKHSSHPADDSRSKVNGEENNVPAASELSFASLPGLKKFNLSELEAATNQFSRENVIGRRGCVYKGVLHDGQVVAVKKFAISKDDDRKAYLYNELRIRSKLDHKNIVKPLGYFYGAIVRDVDYGGQKVEAQDVLCYLVEEYTPNGSLRNILEDGSRLDWSTRFRIILDIAHGVHYLYQQGIVHRDLVPSNILLDSEMNPKITDFGVATELPHSDDCVEGPYVMGTVGYIAPEVLSHIISAKVDVFSFGRVILEIVGSVRRAGAEPSSSVAWAWASLTAGPTDVKLFDPALVQKSQLEEIKRCIQIGLQCITLERDDRPTIGHVLDELDDKRDAEPAATAINQRKDFFRKLLCCHR